jgi:uncharacterized protein YoaH (UPF0181 family)
MAAGDFLLYYQDRLPTIGMGNLANVMILKNEQNKYIGAVAIDQPAYFSNTHSSITLLHLDPFKRIQEIVAKIVSSPEEISDSAGEIFFEAIPESVQKHLDQNKALESIQKGIVSGLSKVMICSEDRLIAIHEALPAASDPRYPVDLSAHLKMLDTIKTAIASAD